MTQLAPQNIAKHSQICRFGTITVPGTYGRYFFKLKNNLEIKNGWRRQQLVAIEMTLLPQQTSQIGRIVTRAVIRTLDKQGSNKEKILINDWALVAVINCEVTTLQSILKLVVSVREQFLELTVGTFSN